MFSKYTPNLKIAIESLKMNKLRSFLTSLGIIFGVAAVIAMLAIGNGAQKELLEQIKLVGVNNIVITPLAEKNEMNIEKKGLPKEEKKYSPGLSLKDAQSIIAVIPATEVASPEVIIETDIVRKGTRAAGNLIGVNPSFFKLANLNLRDGQMFTERQLNWADPVCIIGNAVKARFFSAEDPIGKYIKCGHLWLKVTGTLQEMNISDKAIENLSIRNYNMEVYAPVRSVLMRYRNRSLITEKKLNQGRSGSMNENGDGRKSQPENYHQLDRLVVRVDETMRLTATGNIIARMLERRHNKVKDVQISIPELLLKQEQRTKDIFNIVLGAIAGISLLIGGIGIMNIMLASVLERIKEIGIRMSVGARKSDIVMQFMMEAVLLSLSGGIIGIILGIAITFSVKNFFQIETIISFSSVLISFFVAASVGLIFGIAPAKKAAEQNPVVSLRYE